MSMKSTCWLSTCLFSLSMSVNAAMIDNGPYITDTDTGLDWLHLSYTDNQSYNWASMWEGGGWQYASNDQVVNLFNKMFPDWAPTDTSGYSSSNDTNYDSDNALADTFIDLFGPTITHFGEAWALGFYADEDGIIRMLGVYRCRELPCIQGTDTKIYGPEFTNVHNPASRYGAQYGTFMVRQTSVIPIPSAVWLFGSGLIGLIGIARRKK